MKKNTLIVSLLALLTAVCCNNQTKQSANKDSAVQQPAQAMPMAGSDRYADSVNKGLLADTMKGSPGRMAMGNIGTMHVHIDYGSPGVKGRIIWGGLVPYDSVWVTGAHSATAIAFSEDFMFGDKPVKAGKYALFTIPGRQSWTIILNKNFNQHLADNYNKAEDVARIAVAPATNAAVMQRLTYAVQATDSAKGEIVMDWEMLSVRIPVSRSH